MSVKEHNKKNVLEPWLNLNTLMVLLFAGITLVMRILPHPPNFTPLLALGLFAGSILSTRRWMVVLMVGVMLIGDAWVGFYDGTQMAGVYAALLLACWIGNGFRFSLDGASVGALFGRGTIASLVFFFISNSTVWFYGHLYPKTLSGLWMSWVAGLPFLHYTVGSTLLFATAMFAVHAWAKRKILAETAA